MHGVLGASPENHGGGTLGGPVPPAGRLRGVPGEPEPGQEVRGYVFVLVLLEVAGAVHGGDKAREKGSKSPPANRKEGGEGVTRKRELDELTILTLFAVAALIGIVLGCWLGDLLGFVF